MPYNVRKRKCRQGDGDRGNWVLSYTDRKGKRRRNCHTSRKKAKAQIAAIEMGESEERIDLEPISETLVRCHIRSLLLQALQEQLDWRY